MIDAVLFDLDGTLLDTAPEFAVVVNQLRAEHGMAALPFAAIRRTVSHGARALVSLAFEIEPETAGFEALRLRLLELYAANLASNTRVFPGIGDVLGFLSQRQIPWGVITNKPSQYAKPLLDAMAFAVPCATLVCPDHVSQSKPHPEPMLLACRQLGCRPEHSVYVGDHRRDIEAGSAAGMLTIAAAYGYVDEQDPADSWAADHIVASAADISALLRKHLD